MKLCLSIICFLTTFAWGYPLKLKDKLNEAEPGSYIVTEQNKSFTLVHVHARTDKTITIEEVTIPAARYARQSLPWRQWFERGGPGHTSWTMSQISLETGRFEETFSFTHQGWINLSESDSFLTTLLNLPFQPIPEEKRRRVGLPPGHHKIDHRPLWSPLLIVNGERVAGVPFTAWKARWPSDGTELARKTIEIYIPYKGNENRAFPTYFPYWIEIDGKIGCAKIRVVDSGKDVHSPKGQLPLRPPQLIGEVQQHPSGLALTLKTPSYYHDFTIVAEEIGALLGKTFPLPCITEPIDDSTVSLTVPTDELNKWMVPGESYRFFISPKENPTLCLETRVPLEFHPL